MGWVCTSAEVEFGRARGGDRAITGSLKITGSWGVRVGGTKVKFKAEAGTGSKEGVDLASIVSPPALGSILYPLFFMRPMSFVDVNRNYKLDFTVLFTCRNQKEIVTSTDAIIRCKSK